MLTARIGVLYEDDWSARLATQEVYGTFLAYSSEHNRYVAMVALSSPTIDAALSSIRDHETITGVQVIDRTSPDWTDNQIVTAFIKSKYREIPPMELLTYEGYLTIGTPSLEDGKLYFDLVFDDQDELTELIDLLSAFGETHVAYLSDGFRYNLTPSITTLQELMDALTDRQLEALSVAVSRGYFEERRDVTTAQLAADLGVTNTTVSMHLRNARAHVMRFLLQIYSIADESQPVIDDGHENM